jgi:hypothetical protein
VCHLKEHLCPLLRVGVVIDASADVMNNRRLAQQPPLLAAKAVQRPGEVEQL